MSGANDAKDTDDDFAIWRTVFEQTCFIGPRFHPQARTSTSNNLLLALLW